MNAKIQINNSSRKQVKNIKAQIVQHCEVTMVNKHFTRVVAEMETREGCPITPGATLSKTFHLTPLAKNSKDRGVALDGQLKVRIRPAGQRRNNSTRTRTLGTLFPLHPSPIWINVLAASILKELLGATSCQGIVEALAKRQ